MSSIAPGKPKRRAMRLLCAVGVVVTLFALAGAYWLSAGSRSVTVALRALHYDEAIAAVDRLYQEHPPEPRMSSRLPSPAPLARITPELLLTEEGAYLPTHNSFVVEDGLFILRTGTAFDPTTSGDPHFERVRDRLFRYHISG
jgi:hypothetical protein